MKETARGSQLFPLHVDKVSLFREQLSCECFRSTCLVFILFLFVSSTCHTNATFSENVQRYATPSGSRTPLQHRGRAPSTGPWRWVGLASTPQAQINYSNANSNNSSHTEMCVLDYSVWFLHLLPFSSSAKQTSAQTLFPLVLLMVWQVCSWWPPGTRTGRKDEEGDIVKKNRNSNSVVPSWKQQNQNEWQMFVILY